MLTETDEIEILKEFIKNEGYITLIKPCGNTLYTERETNFLRKDLLEYFEGNCSIIKTKKDTENEVLIRIDTSQLTDSQKIKYIMRYLFLQQNIDSTHFPNINVSSRPH